MEPQVNPEFEMYRQVALRRRRIYRARGQQAMMVGGLGLLCLLLPVVVDVQGMLRGGTAFVLLYTVVCLAFLAMIILGRHWQRMSQSTIETTEIEHIRENGRQRLFQQAQGQFPLGYRLGGIVCGVLGSILIFIGGTFLALFGLQAWDGWGYLVIGGLLLWATLYFTPGEKRRMRRESAQRLNQSLLAGEVTMGEEVNSDRGQIE